MNRIEKGDSRDLLKTVATESVKSIYFDPPFNSNRKYRLTSSDDSIGFDVPLLVWQRTAEILGRI